MITRIGVLEPFQVTNLLQRIETHRKSGMLLIVQGEQQAKLYFQIGRLVYTDALRDSALGEQLVRAAIITQDQLKMALLVRDKRSEVQITEILTKLKFVSQERLYIWVTQQVTALLQDVLAWTDSEASFDEDIQPAAVDCLPFAFNIMSLIPSVPGTIPELNSPIRDDVQQQAEEVKAELSLFNMPKFNIHEGSDRMEMISTILDAPTEVHRVVKQRRVAANITDVTIEGPTVSMAVPKRQRRSILGWEVLLVTIILLAAGLGHGINMFHFPYIENDEGTYMSQAWSLIKQGQLAPYTYWYDHAPAGWIQIAGWNIITGGFHTFGTIIESGRVLMLLIQIASTFMIYCIARKISGNIAAAVIASLLFAFSAYGIYFHRRILLDNIMTFWMLLSILLLLAKRLSLKHVWLSAFALGIGILSKEVIAFLIPVMIYLVFYRSDKSHRWFAVCGWITLLVSILSLYVLMAILKSELFPTGTFLGGNLDHVSLIGTLQYQASRGRDGGILNLHSGFWLVIASWIHDEPMLVIVGTGCAILSVLLIKWHRMVGVMGLLSLSIWFFLARGGEVLGFYLIPLIALLALNCGLVFGIAAHKVKSFMEQRLRCPILLSRSVQMIIVAISLVGILGGYADPNLGFQSNHFELWNAKQVDAQNQALEWVKKHIPVNSTIVVDDSIWTDLRDAGYKNVQWYWKIDLDPAIQVKVLHKNWRNIDYIVTTDQLLHNVGDPRYTMLGQAMAHTTSLIRFDTGNWPVDVRKVNK